MDIEKDIADYQRRMKDMYKNGRYHAFYLTKCIKCMQEGKVNPMPWITHKGPLETFAERDGDVEKGDFMVWMKPETGVIKAVVEMPQ